MKLFSTVILLLLSLTNFAQIILPSQSSWKYFKGTQAPSPSTNWTQSNFDDSNWLTGNSPFRYGDGTGGTELSDMQGNYNSIYLRNEFEIDLTDTIQYLQLSIDYDDGYSIWINGKMAINSNYPTNATYNSTAPANHESGTPVTIQLNPADLTLVSGKNQLAVHGLNTSTSSSDFYFEAEIAVKIKRPVVKGQPKIDIPGGFYNDVFQAIISTENATDTIIYTIDGSDPQTSTSAVMAKTPVSVTIDPDNNNRPKTPVFILRASIYKEGFEASKSITSSYIFLDKVLTQTDPGGAWPKSSDRINGHIIDLPMDPDIVNHAAYKDKLKPALQAIPSISVVTDLSSLFDPGLGIYVNPKEHGVEWERPASFEMINPDGTPAPNLNCGIRIRGGASRNTNNPKHALRFFFREEYGPKKLKYALFGDEGVAEFDKIDLRTSQNYAWSHTESEGRYNIMNREIFSRDMQGKMGSLYTRSRYYHLYLNGMYWGIFQSQERSEANFAESYLKGNSDDYDVVKVMGEDRQLEATDGTLDTWREVWDITRKGFQNMSNYTQLMGLDVQGNPNPELIQHVNAENLIDYVMVIFFTGNYDAPTNVWSNNKGVNNFYAIKNRERRREGFIFFQHDAEHSLLYDKVNVGSGINENRVNIGFLNNNLKMTVSEFRFFQPQYLHHKLMENSEYRQTFIDRVYKWYYKEKLFSQENCQELFSMRSKQIEEAIIAESARWGDTKVQTPRTKNDDWVKAIDQVMNDFFGKRPEIFISQIKAVDWYPNFDAPEFYLNSMLTEAYINQPKLNDILIIKNPDNKGAIYYTLDGTDPRAFGGEIGKTAKTHNGEIQMKFAETTHLKARIKNGNEWSALNEIKLLKSDDLSPLIISEIHYHPLATRTMDSKDLEFIEFKNTGTTSLNLSNLKVEGGISYQFEEGTVIPSNGFVVLASNSTNFREYHLVDPNGEYKGHLSNGGDTIIVTDENKELISLIYGTESPWPVEPDGDGYSLVYNEEVKNTAPEKSDFWRTSHQLNGTPFKDDFRTGIHDIIASKSTFTVYPNPASTHINIVFDGVEPGDLSIKLFNLWGQEVAIIAETTTQQSGAYAEFFDLKKHRLKSGLYVLQLNQNGRIINQKLTVE